MTSYYIWFVLFAVVVYFIATDESIAAAFYYVTKLAKANYEKQKWWLLNNPRNPVVKYLMWRRSVKLAEEIMKDINNGTN